jgi:general secretion pathway protein C
VASTRQRRIAIAIMFATAGLCAAFLAYGGMGLVATWFLPLDTEGFEAAVRRGGAEGALADAAQRDPLRILQRNIFDSETGDLTRVAAAEPTEDEGGDPVVYDPNAPLPACEGAVRLVGSLVNGRNPEWSFAAITGASGTAMLYRQGMNIDGRELLAINPSAVVLRPSGAGPCELMMFAPPGGPHRPTVGAVAPVVQASPVESEEVEAPEREGAISATDMEQGISRVSDTQYTVSRGLVDQLLENQAELMRTARIIPHQENGRTVGVKLYGIRRNSLLGRLGLQNGDMLRTINGYDMTSPDSALEAYARLRSAQNLSVSVVRRGQPSTMEYTIR